MRAITEADSVVPDGYVAVRVLGGQINCSGHGGEQHRRAHRGDIVALPQFQAKQFASDGLVEIVCKTLTGGSNDDDGHQQI